MVGNYRYFVLNSAMNPLIDIRLSKNRVFLLVTVKNAAYSDISVSNARIKRITGQNRQKHAKKNDFHAPEPKNKILLSKEDFEFMESKKMLIVPTSVFLLL